MRFSSLFRLTAFALAASASLSAVAASYILVDLGPNRYPAALNDRGDVAATSRNSRALRWRNGHWQHLYDRLSRARAINRHGDVVGDIGANPMLWYRGKEGRMLPLPGGSHFGIGFGINGSRTVVGLFEADDATIRCFQWTQEGGPVDLGFMATGDYCQPYDINPAGQITGEATIVPSGGLERHPRAFIYSGGAFQDLGLLPGGDRSQGLSINAFGAVAGRASVPPLDSTHFHATVWLDGEIRDFDPEGKYANSVATGINDNDDVVGTVTLASGAQRAVRFRYREPHAVLLQDEVQNLAGWTLEQADDINALGEIVGTGEAPDGRAHAFLLRPASGGRD